MGTISQLAPSHLNSLSDKATHEYLKRANKTALANMIGLCLHAMSPREVVDFLRAEAEQIEEDMCFIGSPHFKSKD